MFQKKTRASKLGFFYTIWNSKIV